MNLHPIDIAIIIAYLITIVIAGFWVSKRASENVEFFFLAGKKIPWYFLGISNASSMFDITGTMWLVYLLFTYGLKSMWIPWVWPTFNQVFLMVYLSIWLRRSNVLTGAEWITTRFGSDKGANLSHISVVIFALVSVIGFMGYMTDSINSITMWIVAGLYGGYIAPNVLKWYWWRLNGYGYFAGMISGVAAALAFPLVMPELSALNSFPYILILSSIVSIVVSLATKPEEIETLKEFYKTVRPWGFWWPVHRLVVSDDPSFVKNSDFKRDMINVVIGIIWQLTLMLVPVYFVIREYKPYVCSISCIGDNLSSVEI